MYRNTKIATCSYCGTRAALVLDRGRHELVCPSCGAPLHDLKAMPLDKRNDQSRPVKRAKDAPHGIPPYRWSDAERARKPAKPKRRSRRKRLVKKVFEEAFDLLEDIFD